MFGALLLGLHGCCLSHLEESPGADIYLLYPITPQIMSIGDERLAVCDLTGCINSMALGSPFLSLPCLYRVHELVALGSLLSGSWYLHLKTSKDVSFVPS